MASRAALLALALLALASGGARADNMGEFGFGARAQAMGGAYTALASDGTATYWNPGGLILSRHLNLTAGFSFADYGLDFDSQRGGFRDDDANRIADLSAFSLAVSSTIPLDIPDRFAFGLGLFLPTRGVVDVNTSADASRPEWFQYGSRNDRVHVLLSFAVKATKWLSLGAGASIFVDAAGGTTISAGVATPVQPEFKLKLKPDAAPVVGVMLTPTEWLSFGLTYRGELSFKLDFPAVAVVQGISIPLDLEAITFYNPHQFQLGAAFSPTDSIILTFDLAWYLWSQYDDPFLVVSSNVAAVPTRVRVDLDDVISPRLGVEVMATDWLFLRGGYAYRTTAVPDQDDEPTNLVDTDKHVFTLGCGFAWGQAPEEVGSDAKVKEGKKAETAAQMLKDASYDLDLFLQLHFHPERSQDKVSPTDPVGNWDAGGFIINFGFAFTLRF